MDNLIIPSDFLYREKRGNFVIGEVMKRSWASYLKIFEDIKEICDKESIKIFACYGTLLGAVRDNGFIAWDDDIDLGLVRDDYIRFLDIISNKYGDRYRVLNPYTRPWFHMNFSHIINGKELDFEREHLKEWYGCPFMMGLDIFPYYYIPRNPADEQYILQLIDKIDETIALSKQSNEITDIPENQRTKEGVLKALSLRLYELQSETGFEFTSERPIDNQLEILYDQVCRLTEENEADYVCRYDEYTVDKRKKFPKEHFKTTIPVKFEMTTMPVPIGYDEVLKKRFGDSYIIPRREAAAHDYPFYKKQLNENIKFGNASLSDVCDYSKPDYSLLKKENNQKVILYHTSIRFMLINSAYVIDKIKDVIVYALKNKDKIKIVWLPDVFCKTDEMALDLVAPNLIEEYEKLICEYKNDGGIVIGHEDLKSDVIDLFDEYFGDDDDIAKEFSKSRKKVTIQEYSDKKSFITKDIKDDEIATKATEDIDNKTFGEVPDEWKDFFYKPDGTRKKGILYFVSVSKIYQSEDKAIEKIKKTLEFFKENKEEIVLLWYNKPIPSEAYGVFGNVFLNDFNGIICKYNNEGWGIYIEEECVKKAINIADAFYGDSDAVTMQMEKMQKPVMLQNYDIVLY